MAESLVVTEAPTRWIHESTGESCDLAGGASSEVPGYGRCYAHQERIKRVIDTRTLLDDVQLAQDAAFGDSNDTEIDLLRGALEEALGLLGLAMPEGRDQE